MMYFDNAATTSPKPLAVRRAVARALAEYTANPGRSGHEAAQRCALAVYECRQKVAGFFGLSREENVIFTPSCTYSVNQVLFGLLHEGDHVVTSPLEHNAVMRPLHELTRRGVSFDAADFSADDEDAMLRSMAALITPRTKLIVCMHASNVFGIRLPIERVAQLCGERGLLLAVDAAQSAGVFPIDMERMGIHYLCVAAHKGLYAPMGCGLLLINGPLPAPLLFGGTGTQSISPEQPEDPPERLESGTLNVPAILGISAGLGFVRTRGADNILRHEISLMQRLYDGLAETRGIQLYTGRPEREGYAPVLSFNVQGMPAEEAGERLGRAGFALRAGLHCAPAAHRHIGTLEQGTVRASVSVFTARDEIDKLVLAVRELAKSHAG